MTDPATLKILWSDKIQLQQLLPKSNRKMMPISGEKNTLITSALPYVNNVPHLGNIIGCVLSGDVYARYCRARGDNVLYICGTDEYGTATETKAIQEKTTPQAICDKYHGIHKGIYEAFGCDFDHFGRTTTKHQTEIAQEIFLQLHENKLTTTKTIEQLYCTKCAMFLADRYVEGICSNCKYEDARGDQCDNCSKLLNPTDLIAPRCKICSSLPELRQSDHIFLDLSTIQPRIAEYLEQQWSRDDCKWSTNAQNITRSWLKEGLRERCITRDLKWGTPVPLEEFSDKVFYVWFDAPIGYISITACLTPEWRKWWYNKEQVDYYNFLGKDNVPFHSIIFPSTLLGTGQPYTIVNHMCATEYLNYEDLKFSKSRGTGVFGDQIAETNIPYDYYRFYLCIQRPETQDTSFNWEDMASRINNELLANLGNFCLRALSFCSSNFDGAVPRIDQMTTDDYTLIESVDKELQNFRHLLDNVRIRDGLHSLLDVSRLGNQYMQNQAPWVLIKSKIEADIQRAQTVLALVIQLVSLLSTLMQPYLPYAAHELRQQLGIMSEFTDTSVVPANFQPTLPEGHKLGKAAPLFRRIENDEVKNLRSKYAGKQAPVPDKKSHSNPKSPKKTKEKHQMNGNVPVPDNEALKQAIRQMTPDQLKDYKKYLTEIEELENAIEMNLARIFKTNEERDKYLTEQKTTINTYIADELKTLESQLVQSRKAKLVPIPEPQRNEPQQATNVSTEQVSNTDIKSGPVPAQTKSVKKEKAQQLKATEPDPSVDISRLDLRVGRIIEATKHPDANSLYVEQIDVGEDKPRTIVSGLVNHVPIEEMQNRPVIVMCNLKPAKMRGIESQGMVMCASTPEKVEIMTPPQGAKPGDRLECKEYPGKPDVQLNPKKKIWESVAPDLKVDADGIMVWKDARITVVGTDNAPHAPSLKAVNVK